MTNIILIGAGNMGFAMLRKWAPRAAGAITVIEPNDHARQRVRELGAIAYASITDMPDEIEAQLVVVATKPRFVGDAIANCCRYISPDGMFMSVAAGVTLAEMARNLAKPTALIRCMPNTPVSIGEGMIVCCVNQFVTDDHRYLATRLLSTLGLVSIVEDESIMDSVTAVSGSGPAYVFYFIEALQKGGIEAGLPDDLALLLAKQIVYGAALLARDSDLLPSTLIAQVTSPNGTTEAAMTVLRSRGRSLAQIISEAVAAAKQRSAELGAGAPQMYA